MYRNNKDKSYNNHWFNWTDSEELYYKVVALVEDMIKELVP